MVLDKRFCLLCKNEGKPLFGIPTDTEKALIWLKAIGKESLLQEYKQTYISNNGRICKNHFEDWCFTSTLQLRLHTIAVPCQLKAPSTPDISTCKKVCVEPEPSTDALREHEIVLPESIIDASSEIDIALISPKTALGPKRRVRVQRTPKTKRIARLVAKNYALQRKVKALQDKARLTKLKDMLTPIQFEFVQCQIKAAKLSDPRGHRWSSRAKALALNIYLKSSAAYKILRKYFAFPSVSTLRRSTGNIAKYDGFCPLVQKVLKEKAKKMNDRDKNCSLVFDEINLKKSLTYNASIDCVDGYASCMKENGESELATLGLLFMIRGLSRNWKQAIAYYFRGSTTPKKWFRETFFDVIRKVRACGFPIINVCCDQGSPNRGLYTYLDLDPDNPVLIVDGTEVHFLHDPPHLIKCVRNNLLNYDVKFKPIKDNDTSREMTASWKDIEEFYKFDCRQGKFRAVEKLTYTHVYPKNLNKMKVKLATQVFSHSVAAGINSLYTLGDSNIKSLDTAEFVQTMNDMFDSLNSKKRFDKGMKAAVAADTQHVEFWKSCVNFVKSWKFMKTPTRFIKLPCQKGLIMTLNAVIGIWEVLREQCKFDYLLTNRLNQDVVENTFSSVRRRGGFNDNPSPYEFRNAIRGVIVHNFVRKSGANCEDDTDINLLEFSNPKGPFMTSLFNSEKEENDEYEEYIGYSKPVLQEGEEPEPMPISTTTPLEDNVLSYISGFLARKYLRKHPCDDCERLLVDTTKVLKLTTILLYFKDYDSTSHDYGLRWPTDELFKSMQHVTEFFYKEIDNYFRKPQVRKNLNLFLQQCEHFDFFKDHSSHRYQARDFFLISFITMMIKYKIRRKNAEIIVQNLNKNESGNPRKKRKLKHVAQV